MFRFTDRYNFYHPEEEFKLRIKKVDNKLNLQLKRSIQTLNLNIEGNQDIIDKLTKGDKEDIHELPSIDMGTIKNSWNKFIIFYLIFIEKIIARLIYSDNPLNRTSIVNFIDMSIESNFDSLTRLRTLTRDILFSDMDYNERVDFLRSYFSYSHN